MNYLHLVMLHSRELLKSELTHLQLGNAFDAGADFGTRGSLSSGARAGGRTFQQKK